METLGKWVCRPNPGWKKEGEGKKEKKGIKSSTTALLVCVYVVYGQEKKEDFMSRCEWKATKFP